MHKKKVFIHYGRKILFIVPRWQSGMKLRPLILKLIERRAELVIITKDPLPEVEISYYMQAGCTAVKPLASYLSHQETETLQQEAVSLMDRLQSYPPFNEATTSEQISLWKSSNAVFFLPLFDVMHCVRAIKAALDTEKPAEIWYWQDRESCLFWHQIAQESLGKFAGYWLNSRIVDYSQVISQAIESRSIKFHFLRLPLWFRTLSPLAVWLILVAYKKYLNHKDRNWKKSPVSVSIESGAFHNSKDIILITSNGSTANFTAVPIAQALGKNGKAKSLIVKMEGYMGSTGEELIRDEGISYVFCQEFANKQTLNKAEKLHKELVRKWAGLASSPQFWEYFEWSDTSLWPAIKTDLKLLFCGHYYQLVKMVEITRRFIDIIQPKAIVDTDYLSSEERAVISLARLKGIPTILATYYSFAEKMPPISILADNMALWGEAMKEFIAKRPTMAPGRMVITGAPGFEYRYLKACDASREQVCHELGMGPGNDLIFYVSQPAQSDYTEVKRRVHLEAIYWAMGQLPNLQFLVKVHPMESPTLHYEMARKAGLQNIKIVKDIDLYRLLKACDLVLTFSSTAGFEAILLDKPIIAINLIGEPVGRIPYLKEGAALGVYSKEKLPLAINQVLKDDDIRKQLKEKRREFVSRYFFRFDGQSATRVAEYVHALIKNTAQPDNKREVNK